jgi:hypothetical protein
MWLRECPATPYSPRYAPTGRWGRHTVNNPFPQFMSQSIIYTDISEKPTTLSSGWITLSWNISKHLHTTQWNASEHGRPHGHHSRHCASCTNPVFATTEQMCILRSLLSMKFEFCLHFTKLIIQNVSLPWWPHTQSLFFFCLISCYIWFLSAAVYNAHIHPLHTFQGLRDKCVNWESNFSYQRFRIRQKPPNRFIFKVLLPTSSTVSSKHTSTYSLHIKITCTRNANLTHCRPVTQICVFCVTTVKDGWHKIAF